MQKNKSQLTSLDAMVNKDEKVELSAYLRPHNYSFARIPSEVSETPSDSEHSPHRFARISFGISSPEFE